MQFYKCQREFEAESDDFPLRCVDLVDENINL